MTTNNKALRIIFFGTPSFVVPVAESLTTHFDLVGVVTASDTIQGRKKILTSSPVKVFGETNNIPVFTPSQFDTSAIQQLKALTPDLFVVAAYGVIIPQNILDLPKFGAINIHPSLLPQYRGASPIQTALLNGDEISGVTIIKMDEQVDHGAIISQWEVPLTPEDTFEKLHGKLFIDAAERLPHIINEYIEEKIQPRPQDDTKATFCERITRESGYFDSNNPPSPEKLDRMIRAYYPWPNAWSIVKIKNTELRIKFLPEKKIQVEGRNPMSIKEFLNGYPELRGKINSILGEN